jgi:hypothetical protein
MQLDLWQLSQPVNHINFSVFLRLLTRHLASVILD